MARAQTTLPEQDKYVKKQYMFIPWGNDKGKIPLRKYNDVRDAPQTFNQGIESFKISTEGNVYVLYLDANLGKNIIKKFLPDGTEAAACTVKEAHRLQWDGADLIAQNISISNQIIVMDKDLKSIKTIDVPKNLWVNKATIKNGVLYNHALEKGDLEQFAYHQNKANNLPALKNSLNDKFRCKLTRKGMETDIEFDRSGTVFKTVNLSQFIDQPIRQIKADYDDALNNSYLQITLGVIPHNEQYDSGILKVSSEGEPLTWIDFGWDDFCTYIPGRVLADVDSKGNIYSVKADSTGINIYQWELKK